ncbi:MAG TPA: hypothetical protein VJV75_12510, partial [Candidatus Polarisedimenticolia bacterium]|nr:hypothetical protein [Candidatus Polarisedimenticolia bacterium]
MLGLLVAGAVGCRGSGGGNAALGPHEGAQHPMVGKAAPDFVGEVSTNRWLPLSSLRGKPVALLFFKTGAPFARELVTAIGSHRNDV